MMYNKMFLSFLFILISFTLNSCEYKNYYLSNNKNITIWEKHKESLFKIENYQIRGVITCSVSQVYSKNFSFIFDKINEKCYRLIFFNFIGWKVFEINISEDKEYNLHKNINNCFSVSDFERIIKTFLNIGITFKNCKSWILGLPGTGCHYILNMYGHLEKISFHDHGNNNSIVILYRSYFNNKTPILPKSIKVLYNNIYFFSIKIYSWNIL